MSKKEKKKDLDSDITVGSFLWPDGSKYSGEYKDSDGIPSRHGSGTYYCSKTESSYIGVWEEDKLVSGTLKFASGASYSGEWKEDKYHGKGTYTWADKVKLIGDWEDNRTVGIAEFHDGCVHWSGEITNNPLTSSARLYVN